MSITVYGNHNSTIIINSDISDSNVTTRPVQKTTHTQAINKESLTQNIMQFAESNNITHDRIRSFASSFLGVEFTSCDELSIIELVNIKKAIEEYF